MYDYNLQRYKFKVQIQTFKIQTRSPWQAFTRDESSDSEEPTWRQQLPIHSPHSESDLEARVDDKDSRSRSGSAERDPGIRLTERPQEEDDEWDGRLRLRLIQNPAHHPALIPRQGLAAAATSHSHAHETAADAAGKGQGKDENFFSKTVSSYKMPSRPGTGKGTRGSWTREGWQLPPEVSGESGPGTRGGLGGEQLQASLDEDVWEALDETARRALALLGRSRPWPSYNRVVIPWPDLMWKTFHGKEHADNYFAWRDRAKAENMELVVRGRVGKKITLSLLGSSKEQMADLLRRVINSCSTVSDEVAHSMNKVCLFCI